MSNYELVNFCEFDRYASKAYCAIHGVDESLNLGDINEVDETKLPDFAMICGGSPCQDFSVAGKGKGSEWHCKDCDHRYNPLMVHYSKRDKCPECGSENIEKTRSSLLVEWLRVIRAKRPSWGLYENVKNIVGKKFKTTFDLFIKELHEYGYNTYYKVLNAKDYGIPQNRERVYVFFVKQSLDNGMFQFPEPFELQLRLKDMLNEVVDEKFYLSETAIKGFQNHKERHLRSRGNGFGWNPTDGNCIANTLLTSCCGRPSDNYIMQVAQIYPNSGNPQAGRIYGPDGISPSLDTCTGGNRMPKILVREATKKGYAEAFEGDSINLEQPSSKTRRGRVGHGVAQRLTTSPKQVAVVAEPKKLFNIYPKNGQAGNVYDANSCAPCIPGFGGGGGGKELKVLEDLRIRKLTPKECFRLMGFSDEDFLSAMCGSRHAAKEILSMHGHDCLEIMQVAETKQKISNTQLYKQAGNSIVVDVLYYIYLEIYRAMPYLFNNLKLCSFFSGIGAFEAALDRFYKTISEY